MVSQRCGGFTLVEVIVALTLLAVGMLGVAGAGLLTSRFVREAELHEEMVGAASNLLDSLTTSPDTGRGIIKLERYSLAWQASPKTVEVNALLAGTSLFVLRAAR